MIGDRIPGDLEDPGLELPGASQPGRAFLDPEEDVLEHVVGVGVVADALADVASQSISEGGPEFRGGRRHGLEARMKALVNFPSTWAAMDFASRPAFARTSAASFTS